MKRLLIGTLLVTALVFPAMASAISRDFSGNVDPSGTIDFTYKKPAGGDRKVVNLIFEAVPVHCTAGDFTTSGNTSGFVFKVQQRKFGARLTNGQGATLNVQGTFTNQYTRAHGTIRVHGNNVPIDPSGSRNGCDTGTDDWHAQTA